MGAGLRRDVGMNVGPTLGIFLVPTNGVGYGLVEGSQYGSNVGVDEENPTGRKKGRGGRSTTGLWPLCGPIFYGRDCAAVIGQRFGGSCYSVGDESW